MMDAPLAQEKDVMFGTLGPTELLLIFAIVMLLFGARKLPEVGRGLGRGIQNFKDAMRGGSDDSNEPTSPPDA
jgi:sec-independent protein translocase protein TatA